MPYALTILWHERSRFLPAIFAVAFSALLIALQCGLLLGLLAFTSLPIDRSSADIWVSNRDVESIALSHPIPEDWRLRLDEQPEVVQTESLLFGFASWHRPDSGSAETCCIVGTRLEDGALGVLRDLTPEMRDRLSEPGAVVVDESERPKLGIKEGAGEVAEVSSRRVRVVGLVRGISSTTAPFVFCSMQTARMLLPLFEANPSQTMYVLARCRSSADAAAVVARLQISHPDMAVFTSDEFSRRTRSYWLIRSKAGTAMACTVVLALLVGLVVTSQTLYAATAASLREYAVLDALGIPRRRLVGLVLAKSFWIGVVGICLALPVSLGLAEAARLLETRVLLPPWVLAGSAALTMGMALLSGVAALRSLRMVEPVSLLR
jgi:putative ABC transport system permease protein